MKTFGVTDYTNLSPLNSWEGQTEGREKCLSSTPIKYEKKIKPLHKIVGAHLQCYQSLC